MRNGVMLVGMVAVALCAGCATGNKNSGDRTLVAQVRQEIARQYDFLGIDPALAANVGITVKTCAPSGQNADGPYVCGGDCAQIAECVHAWELSGWHTDKGSWMFADPPGDWCIRHEVGHFVQRRWGDDPAEVASNNGHPMVVHFSGRAIKTRDLIAGARWPSLVRGLTFWRREEGADLGCAVLDEDGQVIGQKPLTEGVDGDGI